MRKIHINKNSRRLPKGNIIREDAHCGKTFCQGCLRFMRVKHIYFYKGKYLCFFCRNKTESNKLMQSSTTVGKFRYNLEQCLNKEYKVRTYKQNYGHTTASHLFVPSALAGHKVKLIIVGTHDEYYKRLLNTEGRSAIPLEKALSKIYEVKTYYRKHGVHLITLPSAFTGKIVKLVLAD